MIIGSLVVLAAVSVPSAYAQVDEIPPEEFYRAKVTDIISEGQEEVSPGIIEEYQSVEAEILNGKEKDKRVLIDHRGIFSIDQFQKVKVGDVVVLTKVFSIQSGERYQIIDKYRLGALIWIVAVFFGLAIYFGRLKGFTSILGLAFSIGILGWFIVPRIARGESPLAVTLVGSLIIVFVSLYVAHGLSRRTTIALGSTIATLALSVAMAVVAVKFAQLFGRGAEEAFFLSGSEFGTINLEGLLLGGIIIGTLGVLDDITTAQTAVVDELRRANPSLTTGELFKRGILVGREHIASLINTLVLAYAGASMPLFLLFHANKSQPLWMIINSEFIAEEIVRTLIGSAALVLAVPIATILAARFLSSSRTEWPEHETESLHHH